MGTTTKIAWTDHTFNPWIGCSKVHAGCAHCYAEADMDTRRGRVKWGPNGTRSRTSDANWKLPHKWNLDAERDGVRRRVFCASLADVFEDWRGGIHDHTGKRLWIDRDRTFITRETQGGSFAGMRPLTMDDLRRDLFGLIDQTPHLDWLLLTKRPENVQRMWTDRRNQHPDEHYYCEEPGPDTEGAHRCRPWYRKNVWIGTSVSDQETADRAIPALLKCRDLTPVLFVSAEPLLCPIMLHPYHDGRSVRLSQGIDCDWIIVGGESGPNARPCNVEWIRSIVQQCRDAGVPAFVKQLGSAPRAHVTGNDGLAWPDGTMLRHDPVTADELAVFSLRDKKGGDPSEWPEDLRVQEFPR